MQFDKSFVQFLSEKGISEKEFLIWTKDEKELINTAKFSIFKEDEVVDFSKLDKLHTVFKKANGEYALFKYKRDNETETKKLANSVKKTYEILLKEEHFVRINNCKEMLKKRINKLEKYILS